MDYELLTSLIEAFKEYQQSLPVAQKSSLSDFAVWVNNREYSVNTAIGRGHEDIIGRNDIDVEISKLLVYMSRYARLLIRKGLADYPELINEDVTYLYTLMSAESMTKIQLIEKNVQEKPSGLEVIKRLIRHGLIAEREDEQDKRSKRVFLTDKGRQTFFRTVEQMGKVSRVIAGQLSLEEKKQLFTLLKKLEDFHNPLFLDSKHLDISELNERIASQPGT